MAKFDVIRIPPKACEVRQVITQIESSIRELKRALKMTDLNLNGFEIIFVLAKTGCSV